MTLRITLCVALCMALGMGALCVFAQPKQDGLKDFPAGWGSKVLKNRFEAARALPANEVKAIPSIVSVMDNEHWLLRQGVLEQVRSMTDAKTKEKYVEAMKRHKRPEVKENMLFFWALREETSLEDWKVVQEAALDEKEALRVRITAARLLGGFRGQDICKASFVTLLDLLRQLSDKKWVKKVEKDTQLQWLKWVTVYGLEKLTSEEWEDSVSGWEIWWDKNKDLPLKYRDEKEVAEVIEGVKVQGKTFARQRVKKRTKVNLIVMPRFGFRYSYFEPYIYEFSQYFKTKVWNTPNAYDLSDPAKRVVSQGHEGYYYPIPKVAEAFDNARKAEKGRVGIIACEISSFIAMEYAKRSPLDVAFIVCAGSWARFGDMGTAVHVANASKNSVIHWWGYSLQFPPPPMTEEQEFESSIGKIRDMFADPYAIDQYIVNSVGVERGGGDGKQPLIDPAYNFDGKGIVVPALFIWGEDDEWYVKGTEEALSKMFTNAKFVRIPKAGRTPWLENPIAFHGAILNFLQEKGVWDKIVVKEE